MVDSDGNIYLSTTISGYNSKPALFCIESNGNVKWFYPHNNNLDSEVRMNVPTIDKYGNIYYALDTIYSINYNGILNWKRKLDYINDCPLVCSNNCNIFVGTMEMDPNQVIAVSSYNKDGNLLWQLSPDTDSEVGPSPALTPFGLFFPTWRSNNIISIK